MEKFELKKKFSDRHIGPTDTELNEMLSTVGVKNLDELIEKTIPKNILLKEKLNLDEPETEYEFLNKFRELASKNKIYDSYIGLGYYSTITPAPIVRNILENPSWYTSYTPYQAEISQGRLEALLNFQTMITDLTGMSLANASLLDEGTAAAEAMIMFYNLRKKDKKSANIFFVSDECFPQTIDILKTRSTPLGIEIKIGNAKNVELSEDIFGLLVQYPTCDGQINDYSELLNKANENNIFTCVAADLLSLVLLKEPGKFNVDVAVGSTQRFGVPMGFGGPHAAYFATKDDYKRNIPGRIIGVSVDSKERPALRMALQTREQHIKREKATSNICTSQVLLANIAGMYAVYHGPQGLKRIAQKISNLTQLLNLGLKELGYSQENTLFFDTLKIKVSNEEVVNKIKTESENNKINFRYFGENNIGISIAETTELSDVKTILQIFANAYGSAFSSLDFEKLAENVNDNLFGSLNRTSDYLTHDVFNSYRSETELMRYIKLLERKDISLTHSMIPLGSCTMKLNAATEMFPITWPEFSSIHPFVPKNQAEGYSELISELEKQLSIITGFAGVSLQPNSGAQGEYAGLMVIQAYHRSRGHNNRNVVLIPSSAHGTNPASAVMAGGKVIIVKCDEKGNIDVNDLREKAIANKENLSSIMVTYPSTHGVFEENIREICEIIHENGGQVYMDGANLNAQLALTNPGFIGADVCHLNLHKTFCIPHGGGGPGMGPIGVAEQLLPFLPGHAVVDMGGENAISAISAAPWGSASILPISYAYIKMMGEEGLSEATKYAIIGANYLKAKLQKEYKVLYSGTKGFVAHELIFDMREFKACCGIEVEDIAKRLMDYGYHAPTVSFPVPGTLMVEPTESESKYELDKFIDAMLMIREEIRDVENGKSDKDDNLLKNAPHTQEDVISENWNHSYTREQAAFPTSWVKNNKFWPPVSRVNNAYGDRNLVCSCLPIEAYEETEV